MTKTVTPCSALFDLMKRGGGISYKELASLLLSGRPLSDGKSPLSRVNDRTWVSRFIVHAPMGSLQDKYFCDFGISAVRVIARLKSSDGRAFTSEQVLDLICGEQGRAMEQALKANQQDTSLYRNVLMRLSEGNGYTLDERVEVAMVLLVTAGCTGSVHRAVERALDYSQSIHGSRLNTPPSEAIQEAHGIAQGFAGERVPHALQLLRIEDGFVSGVPHMIEPTQEGVVIGALALEDGAITDVGPAVSGRHARVCFDGKRWLVEGLGSRNGTVVIDGVTRERTVVEPPHDEHEEDIVSEPVELHPGDELELGEDTTFVVLG